MYIACKTAVQNPFRPFPNMCLTQPFHTTSLRDGSGISGSHFKRISSRILGILVATSY